jgi:hypothetical protein
VVRADPAVGILGTSEQLLGWASASAWVEADGSIGWDHSDEGCGAFEDSSETLVDNQRRPLFAGSDGRNYTLDQLAVVSD